MNKTISNYFLEEKAFSKQIRVRVFDGNAYTQPCTVESKNYKSGVLYARFVADFSKDLLAGREIDKVTLCAEPDGDEIVSGDVSVYPQGDSIKIAVTIAFNALPGWQGCEEFFDMLVGISPFHFDNFTIEGNGNIVEAFVGIDDNYIRFSAAFDADEYVLRYNGKPVIKYVNTSGDENGTYTVDLGGELDITDNVTALKSVIGSSDSDDLPMDEIYYPTELGEEQLVSFSHNGSIKAFDSYLVLYDDKVFILMQSGKIVSVRKVNVLKDVHVHKSGVYAIVDNDGVSVCRNCDELAHFDTSARSALVTMSGDEYYVHIAENGSLSGYKLVEDGPSLAYNKPLDCLLLTDFCENVFALCQDYTYLLNATDGTQLFKNSIANGGVQYIVDKSKGLFIIKANNATIALLPKIQTAMEGNVISLSGRTVLYESGGVKKLAVFGTETSRDICNSDAEKIAFADKLYYIKNKALYSRTPLKKSVRAVREDFACGETMRVIISKPLTLGRADIWLSIDTY